MDGPEELLKDREQPREAESGPLMEPVCLLGAAAPASRSYWQAQSMADRLQRGFEAALASGDSPAVRRNFYLLARYYGRTLAILRHALASCREPLLRAALHNLVTLHRPLHRMHAVAPSRVPFVVTLEPRLRARLVEDLTVELLQEAPKPLDLSTLAARVNELHVTAELDEVALSGHLDNLTASGHVGLGVRGYTRTRRPYSTVNLDRGCLMALLGDRIYPRFEKGGFHGLAEITARREAFRGFFETLTGFGAETADLFAAAARELIGPAAATPDWTPWHHADLVGSPVPRPYQHDAHAIFRGYGYAGQVIEAPTGSGKTLIGMLCLQEWLGTLSPGESILILVPTVNYQQQWVGELCTNPLGLRLTPDVVYTGTPTGLKRERAHSGMAPGVLIMTYAALAQAGSRTGKGGVDRNSIERFLQGGGVQYVILDEVHKVVEDLRSVSADMTRMLTEWLRDGSLRGVIGFSGTAAAYRKRFTRLGLQLVYTLPTADLIAYGFVAPFAEFGVPFAYSDREQRIGDLLAGYKKLLREYLDMLGGVRVRRWFGAIPMAERVRLGRDVFRLYGGRKGRTEALQARMEAWEQGGEIGLGELPVLLMVQCYRRRSDEALLSDALGHASGTEQTAARHHFDVMVKALDDIRRELATLIFFPDIQQWLQADGFARSWRDLAPKDPAAGARSAVQFDARLRETLACTIAGLYDGLRRLYLRVGEGRVDCIKTIIAAERATRPVSGVIVFDKGTRIRWDRGPAVPGYAGVAGVFSQMLGDGRFCPMAALSGEIYLPYDEKAPVPEQIARFVERRIMSEELGAALFALVSQGLGLPAEDMAALQRESADTLALYVRGLDWVRAHRPREFEREVLRPLRKFMLERCSREQRVGIRARLSRRNPHMRKWIDTFFDYALIGARFRIAHRAELRQADGRLQPFFVVTMAGGERRQLMYDLTARILDAEDLPVNMVIVSPWARTGWNVIRPNLLIDATATRSVTAWQQLRGRAMRAVRTWDATCYRMMIALLGEPDTGHDATEPLPPDVAAALEAEHKGEPPAGLDRRAMEMLSAVHEEARRRYGAQPEDDLGARLGHGRPSALGREDRERLAVELMLTRNKVTHIYEMIKAYGSGRQVRYDRGRKSWQRSEAVADKHAREYAVNPYSGEYGAGQGHAPLICVDDPRRNHPSKLRGVLQRDIDGRDPTIVRGWIQALREGMRTDVTLD